MAKQVEVVAQVSGSVWKVMVSPGQAVEPEDVLMVVESMKMEIPVEAGCRGRVQNILRAEGEAVSEGETVAVVGTD